MLFHTFRSQDERRAFGGSYFIELQYCKLAPNADLKQIVSVDSIVNWANDSLYIHGDDDGAFLSQYGEILTGGIYNNGETGPADLCGINYYSPQQARLIAERIMEQKPLELQVLLDWLERGTGYNGFYLLGL